MKQQKYCMIPVIFCPEIAVYVILALYSKQLFFQLLSYCDVISRFFPPLEYK